jgi:hypothetical protein
MDRQSGSWYVQPYIESWMTLLTFPGITPFVKPDDLKFYFEEIHRLTSS